MKRTTLGVLLIGFLILNLIAAIAITIYSRSKPVQTPRLVRPRAIPSSTRISYKSEYPGYTLTDGKALAPAKVVSLKKLSVPAVVYNMTVAGAPTYFADRIAVHNAVQKSTSVLTNPSATLAPGTTAAPTPIPSVGYADDPSLHPYDVRTLRVGKHRAFV